jgi:hypothetical protein
VFWRLTYGHYHFGSQEKNNRSIFFSISLVIGPNLFSVLS